MVQHQLAGARVRTEFVIGGIRRSEIVPGPFGMDLTMFAQQGVTQFVVAIRVRNIGRLSVDVTGFDVEFELGGTYSRTG